MSNYNPFTLTFGKQPHLLIKRNDAIKSVTDMYNAEHSVAQTYLIEGIRGSGKTVLMTTIAKALAADDNWVTVDLNAAVDLIDDLARTLENTIRHIPNILEKGVSISAFGFGLGFNGTDEIRDSVSRVESMLELLQKKNKRLLITIDEVVNNREMKVFASQFQIFLRHDYPVYLIMTGLHENIYTIQNDPQLTFLLRSPKLEMTPLASSAIVREYEEVFNIGENTALQLARITKGYPFAFQALGTLYWDHREELPLEKILERLDVLLDEYVYSKIWSTLTEQEKKVLLAMEDDEKITSKEIVQRSGINEASVSKYRRRLIDKGIVTAPEYGYIELALPRFKHVIRLY